MFDLCLSSFRFHTLGSSPCVAIISVGVAGQMFVPTVLVRTSSSSLFIPTLFGLCRRRAVRPLSVLWAICSPVLLRTTYKTGVVRRRRTGTEVMLTFTFAFAFAFSFAFSFSFSFSSGILEHGLGLLGHLKEWERRVGFVHFFRPFFSTFSSFSRRFLVCAQT